MTKFVFVIAVLLTTTGITVRGQETVALSDADRAAIVESVLDPELRNQSSVPDFANIRDVSSDNIELIEASQLSKHGFTLVPAADLRQSKKDHVVSYLLFRNISLRDDVAVVKLSRVTEGRPCFGAPISSERTYTYEARRSSGVWVANLIARPAPPVPKVFKWSVVAR